MTIFGPDISSYQHGIDLSRLPNAAFVIAKVAEGTYYTDPDYNGWRLQAHTLGKPFIAYDFVRSDETPADQAAWIAAHIIDPMLPLMLDVETEGASKPTFPQVVALIDACIKIGLRPKLVYLPHWYWQQIGAPDMNALNTRRIGLISSAYEGGATYPGDNGPGWQPYGGVTPMLWQYTDVSPGAGDMNAYRGSLADLANFLGTTTPAPAPNPPGDAMAQIPPSISQKWPDLAAEFPAGADYNDETALIWADGGARAAALYALQARDAINTLANKLATPPAIDVNALAAAIAPHLTADATADTIAAAVLHHLSTATASG